MVAKNLDYLGQMRKRLLAQYKFLLPFGPVFRKGSGTGVFQISGPQPNVEHQIALRVDTNGQSGAASWSYSIDGAAYVSVGAVASAPIGPTGLTAALVNGGSTPSFIGGDVYSFHAPYRGRIDGALQAYAAEFQEFENAVWDVLVDRLIQNGFVNANDDDLEDKIGGIVGQARGGASNSVFDLLIQARILANHSDGKRESLIGITSTLVPSTPIFVQEYVGSIYIEPLGGPSTLDPGLVASQFLIGASSSGIRLYYIVDFRPTVDEFTYTSVYYSVDPTVATQGYGSTYDASLGGYYVGVVTE